MSRPNVILILTDDQGYGDIGCFGNAQIRTPNLDRLAQEGLRLTQHYSGSPICAPARAALLTGRYNHRVGALSVESNRGLDRISLRDRTLADAFKAAGYATGMVGKWHSGLHNMRYHPNRRGFDEFVGFLNGGMDYYEWILDVNGQPRWSDGTYLTDVFSNEAADFINRHRKAPFFLHLAFNAPHSPLQAPEEDVAPYAETGRFTRAVNITYAMIQRMDAGVGRVLDALERNGLAHNTILLFTSDNGPVLTGRSDACQMRYNGPFRGMKYDVLEGGIRVPALLRWPDGLPRGREFHDMVHFCDWMPTLLHACGIDAGGSLPLDGVNVMPALQGEGGKVPDKRFWQFNRYEPVVHCNGAMRDGEWKLYRPRIPEAMQKLKEDGAAFLKSLERPHLLMDVANPPVERTLSPPGRPELYNIARDPHEENDLSAQQPERLARMMREYENWFEGVESERRGLPENGY